eukprot:5174006-Prymnesium_polylepis.1
MAATHPGWSLAPRKPRPARCLSSGLKKQKRERGLTEQVHQGASKTLRPSLSDVWLRITTYSSTREITAHNFCTPHSRRDPTVSLQVLNKSRWGGFAGGCPRPRAVDPSTDLCPTKR